jgi:hypothetical protein
MEARVFEVDLVPLFFGYVAKHRVFGTMRLPFQARNGCMKISQALFSGRWSGRDGFRAVGWKPEACRHRAVHQLFLEDPGRESTPARSQRRLILAINFCDRQPQPAAEIRHEGWLGDAVIRLDAAVPHRVSMSRLASQAGP